MIAAYHHEPMSFSVAGLNTILINRMYVYRSFRIFISKMKSSRTLDLKMLEIQQQHLGKAVIRRDVKKARELLSWHKLCVNDNPTGDLLYLAVKRTDTPMVKLLLQYSKTDPSSYLWLTIQAVGDVDTVRQFIEAGTNIELKSQYLLEFC